MVTRDRWHLNVTEMTANSWHELINLTALDTDIVIFESSLVLHILMALFYRILGILGGSVAEWLACWTQVQKGPGSNRSRDAVG